MEPTPEASQPLDQIQSSSIPADTGNTSIPTKLSNNNIKIGLLVFLGIIIFLIVALGYAAYNYQGVPKEKPKNEISNINSENTSEQKQVNQEIENIITPDTQVGNDTIATSSEEKGEIVPMPGEVINETNPTPENLEAFPPTIIKESSEAMVCSENTIWNGQSCQELTNLKLTENKAPAEIVNNQIIFAAGGYNGIKQPGKYIDDSGHDTTVFNVSVNYSDKPVVLVLGAYEPSIWNIRIAKGTRLEKIILGGYHQQIVTGIFKTIPVEKHIYQESKTNDYFYISKGETTKSSLKRFGEIDTLYYPNEKGNIEIGNTVTTETVWIQDPTNTSYENYYKKGGELGGEPGLDYLIQKGVLRAATPEDAVEWFEALRNDPNSYFSKKEGYPITDPDDLAILRNKYTPKGGGSIYYVALKDFTLPSGMYWKFSFYVPKGITIQGDISNGSIYDYNTMNCRGSCNGTR